MDTTKRMRSEQVMTYPEADDGNDDVTTYM